MTWQTGPHCSYPSHPPPLALRLVTLPEQPCAYLPGKLETVRGFAAEAMPGDLYHRFMDAGFRRNGRVFYQPVCSGCRACQPIRLEVARFALTKSQRRAWRRNADVRVSTAEPVPSDEKFELFERYEAGRHGRENSAEEAARAQRREHFEEFLYRSPVQTLEFCYRDQAGRLLAVGICDVCSRSVSSVYFYFDPAEARRGLGTFSALCEIDFARRHGIGHYYLGFWVAGCARMQYKARFGPCEVLEADGACRAPANHGAGTDAESEDR